jgi:D-serine deaminase-like pyridoxal phosphate-dependent protein
MTALQDLATPTLVLDAVRMQRNIDRMHDRAEQLGVMIRPHVKTCKSVDVARAMLRRQTRGITVSTLLEAEHFAQHGEKDIFYAVPLSPDKVARTARLLRQGVDLICCVHTLDAVHAVAAAATAEGVRVPMLIDVDVDHIRSGVEADDPAFMTIAAAIDRAPGLELRGIMVYAGGSYECSGVPAMAALSERIRLGGIHARQRLLAAGLPCAVVSFGSSPGTFFAQSMQGITESRAGVYAFQDLFQAGIGACSVDDIAISVLTTVIGSQPSLGRVFIDAGGLALSKDLSTRGRPFDAGYGLVADADSGQPIGDLRVTSASQEVGTIRSPTGALETNDFPVGRRLRVLPNHACFTAAAYPQYQVIEGGPQVVAVWPRINGW